MRRKSDTVLGHRTGYEPCLLSTVKLSIVTETFPPEINGVAMTFGHLSLALARRGHEVTVYRPRRDDLPNASVSRDYREVLMRGVPIPGYPLLRLGLPAASALRTQWRENRPDLVHVVTEGPLGASAVSVARSLRIPVTSSFHTNFQSYTRYYGFPLLRRAALGWLRRIHNRTACTFAPTTELCEELQQLGFERVRVLSRGVDTDQFTPDLRSNALRQSWGARPDDPVVLHAGRLGVPNQTLGVRNSGRSSLPSFSSVKPIGGSSEASELNRGKRR